jgi:hypothetical protein
MKEATKAKLCGNCKKLMMIEHAPVYYYCNNRLEAVKWQTYWKHSHDQMRLCDVKKCRSWDDFKFKILKIKERNERNSIKLQVLPIKMWLL